MQWAAISNKAYLDDEWKHAEHIAFAVLSSNHTLLRWSSQSVINDLFAFASSSCYHILVTTNKQNFNLQPKRNSQGITKKR